MSTPRILHVEPQAKVVALVKGELLANFPAYEHFHVEHAADFRDALASFQPDVIITSYHLPQSNGLSLLADASAQAPHIPVIVFTEPIDEATAVACMKAGAVDYLTQDNVHRLGTAVQQAWQTKQQRDQQLLTEQATRETAESVKKMHQLAQIGAYWFDIKTGKWNSTPLLDQIFGIDETYPKNIEGWSQLVHPAYEAKIREQLTRFILKGDQTYDKEYPIIRPNDGAERWIRTERELEYNPRGRAIKMYGTVQDITQRKLMEKAMSESEFFLRQSQAAARIGSFSLDIKTGLFTTSQTLDELFGIDEQYPKDVSGWTALARPDHRVQMLRYMTQHVLIKHNRFDYEYPGIRQNDKKERWYHGLGEVEVDENGRAIRLVGTVQDITDRHRAEEMLQRTRYSVDNVADAVFWINKDAKFVDVNETACRELGYTREEILNLRVEDIDPNFLPDQWEAVWENTKRTGRRSLVTQHITKSGEICPVEINAKILEFNGQELNCAVARNIAERQAAETRLRESEERLKRFSDVTKEGILFHHNGIIQDVNASMSQMFGYEPEETIGRSLLDFVPPEEHVTLLPKIIQREEQPYESRGLRKDGTTFPLEVIARSFDFEGKQLRVACLRDITERKQIELERLENLKFFESLDRVNRTLQKSDDIEQMMQDTLDEVLAIFECDRAFLLYACDPDAPTWEVPMERTNPEYPGVFELGRPMPTTSTERNLINLLLSTDEPIEFKPGEEFNPNDELWKTFQIKSVLSIALHPKVGKPWQFGLHQCSATREWTPQEKKLFQAISRRFADTLGTMLIHRNLQESEDRYREAQRMARLGHWSFDPKQSQFLWWSEETFRLVGLAPTNDNPTYEEFLARVHPDDHQHIDTRLAQTLATGEPIEIEYRVPLANGETRILEARGQAHVDTDQQVSLLNGTIMDITERKRAAEKLLYQATLLENITDAIIGIDLEYRVVSWNRAAEKLYGWLAHEAVGQNVVELLQTQVVGESPKAPSEILLEEKQWRGEILQTAKDGTQLSILASSSLIKDDNGKPTGFVTVNRDITRRKQTEIALQQSEERLQQAVNVGGIGTFDHDHFTDVIYYSPQLRKMWGIGPSEAATVSNLVSRIHPDDQERINQAIQQAHSPSGDGKYEVEQRIILPDKSIRWQSVRARTYFAGEGEARRPIRTVGAVIDITDVRTAEIARDKLEEQLRQAQKLESLGRLAGGIAHDFNNLLVPMIGYTELGQMRVPTDSKAYSYFEKIGKAATRAADLTKQILAFSRRQMLEIGLFDLNDVVLGFRDMLQRLIGEDVHMQIFPSLLPCLISADRTQIEQILMNLVINARDAMPQGGQLILETDTVYLDESYARTHPDTEPGHYTMLSISDTGQGMDSETQRHIFDPFFTTKAHGKGTGLGLATVFGIVKQHHGNIWVYSEPNEGTTFKIYLPRPSEATQLNSVLVPQMPTVYGSETVLVVEDEPMVRKLACETLATYGYTVLEALNPQNGLQIAVTYDGKIDLLLTDVIMPEMNGRELYTKIVEIRPDIKVLFMSGYTDNVVVHHGVLDEGVNFLEKPFTIRHFSQKIRSVLDA